MHSMEASMAFSECSNVLNEAVFLLQGSHVLNEAAFLLQGSHVLNEAVFLHVHVAVYSMEGSNKLNEGQQCTQQSVALYLKESSNKLYGRGGSGGGRCNELCAQ